MSYHKAQQRPARSGPSHPPGSRGSAGGPTRGPLPHPLHCAPGHGPEGPNGWGDCVWDKVGRFKGLLAEAELLRGHF